MPQLSKKIVQSKDAPANGQILGGQKANSALPVRHFDVRLTAPSKAFTPAKQAATIQSSVTSLPLREIEDQMIEGGRSIDEDVSEGRMLAGKRPIDEDDDSEVETFR